MHRLRKKLREHYAQAGDGDVVEIVLPIGRYEPEFILKGVEPRPELGNSANPLAVTAIVPSPPELPPIAAENPLGKTPGQGKTWIAVAAVLILLCLAAVGLVRARHQDGSRAVPPSSATSAAAVSTDAVRVLSGSVGDINEDREGKKWGADQYYSGGSAVARPDEPLFRTRDALLFRRMRTGEFAYKIPLRPGTYEMRLYFADLPYHPGNEMEGAENVRVFSVWMNDRPLLRDFDLAADAGPNTADIKVFKDVAPASDGFLHLRFAKQVNDPLLNAIEIVPGIPHRQRPIRISTQDREWKDRDGVLWSPDNYFLNGRTIAHVGGVTGVADPQLYGRERYGNFSYAIPVSPGRYQAKLHFAETYWGPNGSGGGGAGSRLFDVTCNGEALLRNFDLFQAAGTNTQYVKTFEHLEPNAQGKLLLSFVPSKNYAMVSAIEVLDEGDRHAP
jgi:hypothetical protein